LLALLVALSPPASAATAAASERILTDSHSGIALYGFDPVAYFIDGSARAGKAAHELTWDGVTWRFVNEGNMAAFAADPSVYVPAFGGYDGALMAEARPVGADPSIFVIRGSRLFLFRSAETRERFLAEDLADRADRAWPDVKIQLAP
jgi:hypothetical protein